MYYFEKMSSASGGFAPKPHQGSASGPHLETYVPHIPSLPTPVRNPADADG